VRGVEGNVADKTGARMFQLAGGERDQRRPLRWTEGTRQCFGSEMLRGRGALITRGEGLWDGVRRLVLWGGRTLLTDLRQALNGEQSEGRKAQYVLQRW